MHGSFPCLPCGYVLTCKPADVIPFSGRSAIPKLVADASWLLEVCLAALPAAGPCWHHYWNMSKHCKVHLSQLSSWGLSISDWRNHWERQACLFIRLRNRDVFLQYKAFCNSGKPGVRIPGVMRLDWRDRLRLLGEIAAQNGEAVSGTSSTGCTGRRCSHIPGGVRDVMSGHGGAGGLVGRWLTRRPWSSFPTLPIRWQLGEKGGSCFAGLFVRYMKKHTTRLITGLSAETSRHTKEKTDFISSGGGLEGKPRRTTTRYSAANSLTAPAPRMRTAALSHLCAALSRRSSNSMEGAGRVLASLAMAAPARHAEGGRSLRGRSVPAHPVRPRARGCGLGACCAGAAAAPEVSWGRRAVWRRLRKRQRGERPVPSSLPARPRFAASRRCVSSAGSRTRISTEIRRRRRGWEAGRWTAEGCGRDCGLSRAALRAGGGSPRFSRKAALCVGPGSIRGSSVTALALIKEKQK